jgi:hypothetical protein
MSYIIKSTNPFIRVKLTEIGRQKLALGQLTYSSWAVGDSEIDYGYVSPNLPGVNEQILRPKDQQPNLKYFLIKNDGSIKTPLTAADTKLLGITVNNLADERGFFNTVGTPTNGWPILTGPSYAITTGTLPCNRFNGGNTIDLGVPVGPCDFVLFIVTNPVKGALASSFAYDPVPYLWFQVQSGLTVGTTVTLDRYLPNLSGGFLGACGGTPLIQFIVYPGCDDPINTYYGSACTTSYWNTGTLTFESSCDVSIADVLVWNQNNVWCEDMIGTSGSTQTHREYGSIDYIGEKQYLGYPCECVSGSSQNICDNPVQSYDDTLQKGIGIIHYTNNTISNFYGEFFYIDSTKILKLDIPTVMWHNRYFAGGSGTGDIIGMRFISDVLLKTVQNTNIEYYDLIEDPTLIAPTASPKVVGRVYPQLKIIVISDEELLAAMSYKSNRNWTLPKLNATLGAPSGTTVGVLAPGETLFLTYEIRPTSGLKPSLPCQKYVKITNTTSTSKDVNFTLEGVGLLPYMREREAAGYDGLGFYGQQFVLLSQKVTDEQCRPDPALWRETFWIDTTGGGTLNPLEIENQNSLVNDFILTGIRYSAGTFYNIGTQLNVPNAGQTTIMTFGDERFFYGNLETYIGAKIFKTIFNLNVSRNQFVNTSNPSYSSSNNGILNITEIGIYDNVGDLVMIAKISNPIPLPAGSIANIEMTLDF